jgi:iron complex outermembrane receptor protein
VSTEYEGLPREAVALGSDGVDVNAGSLRADRSLTGGALSLEGGLAGGHGAIFVTPASRGLQGDTWWTWGRAAVKRANWNASGAFNRRTGDATLLSTGGLLVTTGAAYAFEVQHQRQVRRGRGRLLAGASYDHHRLDSANESGVQTLFAAPVRSHRAGLFGQLDVDVTGWLKMVVAAREDLSTLHDARLSPRVSVVLAPASGHRLRVGYNRAFQVATYTELFVDVPAAPPQDLSPLEALFAPLLGGASLGFDAVPVRVVGNEDLEVEQVGAVEIGYSGVIGKRLLIGIDLYHNRMRDFISGFLPGANARFGPYRAPSTVPRDLAAAIEGTVGALVPGLTNDASGQPAIVLSTTNYGRVHSQGAELTATWFVSPVWRLHGSYSLFDLSVEEAGPAASVFANAPRHTLKAGASVGRGPLLTSLDVRRTEGFFWSSGVFSGDVPTHTVVDLGATYRFSPRWEAGLTVSNLLDRHHRETFGGDVLRRFALASLAVHF